MQVSEEINFEYFSWVAVFAYTLIKFSVNRI